MEDTGDIENVRVKGDVEDTGDTEGTGDMEDTQET